MKSDLLGFGIAAVDEIVAVAEFPLRDTKAPAVSIRRRLGGQCAVALAAAARLDASCFYAGALGVNEPSEFVRTELARNGVKVNLESAQPEARPYYAVILADQSTGERTILYTGEHVQAAAADEALIRETRMLFLDQLGPLEAARIARRKGIAVMADLERVPSPEFLELATHLILPFHVAAGLTGSSKPEETVAGLAQIRRPLTAITRGEGGCWYATAVNPVRHQPAFPAHATDTTGCGDIFHGACAAALLEGMEPPAAMRFAAAAAALRAAGEAFPSRTAISRLLSAA